MGYLGLQFGGAPVNSREDDGLDLEYGIKAFSAYPGRNSLVISEEWCDLGDWIQPGTSWYPIAANESEAYGGIENYDSAFTSAMRGTP